MFKRFRIIKFGRKINNYNKLVHNALMLRLLVSIRNELKFK